MDRMHRRKRHVTSTQINSMLCQTFANSSLYLDMVRSFIILPSGLQSFSKLVNMLTTEGIMKKTWTMEIIGKKSIEGAKGIEREMPKTLLISQNKIELRSGNKLEIEGNREEG